MALDDAAKLTIVGNTLERGTGFVVLRGLPADELPQDLLETIYWGIGLHLGVGVAQSTAGDRLGHVFDRGAPEKERYYTRGGAGEARALGVRREATRACGGTVQRNTLSGARLLRCVGAGRPHRVVGDSRRPRSGGVGGWCSGAELLAALVVDCEVGTRLNLTESMYDGFDPTGVAVVRIDGGSGASCGCRRNRP